MDPNFPLTWQLRKESAGAGPQLDLNSHSVDLARYLVGEIGAVSAMSRRFREETPYRDRGWNVQVGRGRIRDGGGYGGRCPLHAG
jgi:predicted dehydrogenase